MSSTADIVIVGGGVMGCSIAWHLTKRQPGCVVLLEKTFLGAGSSGKSGAIIRQHYSNRLTVQMARYGLPFFRDFAEIVGGPPVFTHSGMVLVVDERDREALEANVRMQREIGVDVRFVTGDELGEIDPNARLGENELAVFEAEAGYVEAVQVVSSLANAARKLGASIHEGVEVREILIKKGKVVGIETNEGKYETKTVVLATGAWAGELSKRVKVPLPVQACRTQVALYRKPTDFGRGGPVYGDFVHGVYFKPTHGEMLHAGSLKGEEAENPVDPDDYDESADGDWLPQVRQSLSRRYPAMHRSFGRGGYGALYGITPDWHPILDVFPGIDGLYCAVGFSGHGFKMAPAVGQIISEWIIDGQPSTLDISPLGLSRFAEGNAITTPYAYGVMG